MVTTVAFQWLFHCICEAATAGQWLDVYVVIPQGPLWWMRCNYTVNKCIYKLVIYIKIKREKHIVSAFQSKWNTRLYRILHIQNKSGFFFCRIPVLQL